MRIQLLRLLVVIRWLPNLKAIGDLVGRQTQSIQKSRAFTQAADELYAASGILVGARTQAFDVVTAVDVLSSGTYRRLPRLQRLWNEGRRVLDGGALHSVAQQLTDRMRVKLLQDALLDGVQVPPPPPGFV